VELNRIELRGQLLVFLHGNLRAIMIHSSMPGTCSPFHSPAGIT